MTGSEQIHCDVVVFKVGRDVVKEPGQERDKHRIDKKQYQTPG